MAEVAQSQILPAPFIEAAAKPYLEKIQEVYGKPVDVSKFMGQQFVAGPGALQTQAEGLAGGLGGFQPYLQAAQAATGPQAYQAYTSPYQQDVIQSTLAEYDFQAQKGLPQLAAQAIGAGAFGGGREGVQRAEYQAMSDRNRAALFAQLQQQGFGQAQQLAAQAFGQQQQLASGQLGLGQAQMGLAQLAPSLVGSQIAGLSALGAQQQGQTQAGLTAQQQLAQAQATEEQQRLSQLGSGITSLIAGYPAQTQTQMTPSPSGLATGLGTASTLAGIYRLYKGQYG
jgi:hypothetical protein